MTARPAETGGKMTSQARLAVDASRCTGHGRCYDAAPDLLSDDEEGFVSLRGQSMPITGEQLADARKAALACPERAVILAESG
jgi:ferredoxin